VQGIGYVEPVSEIRRLAFKLDGVVRQCSVEVGQSVACGDVLMTLGDAEEAAAVAVAEKKLASAVAEREQLLAGIHPERIAAAEKKLKRLQEVAAHARKHHTRIATLHGKKTTTEAEHDEAEIALLQADAARDEAEAELTAMQKHVRPVDRAVAEANVAQAEAQLAAARVRLEQTVLRAPSDGRILEILRREGEASRGPQDEPVLIFADDSRLRVRAEIDERYVSLLHEGQSARVFGRGLGDKSYHGTVAIVKRLMGNKTVFSRAASERKDLDVLQVLIDMNEPFQAPLGLQVDVEVILRETPGHGKKSASDTPTDLRGTVDW
jgi:multidrug resistance efflux pump